MDEIWQANAMCGKFTQMATWAQVVEFSRLLTLASDESVTTTPMRVAHVIHLDGNGKRITTPMRWGFIDSRSGSRDIPRNMHARCETIDRLPTFAGAFAERRGIVIVDTFNEGEEVDVLYADGSPSGRKWTRQWVVRQGNGAPLAIAVIFQTAQIGGRSIETFVQVTTPANQLISKITDRMPAILHPDDWEVWLGEMQTPLEEVKSRLKTYEDGGSWVMAPENPTKRPPRPKKPEAGQGTLF